MSSDQARDESEGAESYAPASVQKDNSSSRRPMSGGREEAKAAFFEIMDEWFEEYMRNHPKIPRPSPPATQPEGAPRVVEPVRLGKAPIVKLRKYGAEEFRATLDDDPERAKFWLENTMRVLDDLSCTLEEILKCVVSLLKDTKRKEFLELKQGDRTVSKYGREFVRLSQYVNERVLREVEMCKRFEEGLNEEIKLLIGILEIREFAALADRAKKAEGLNNERKQAKRETQVSSKRTSSKAHSFPTKKSRSHQDRSTSSVGYSGSAKSSKRHNLKSSSPSATCVGSVDDQRPKCMSCNKFHFGKCRMKSRACYRCGSLDHFLRNCLKR
ncbi:uncharacterized protein LOC108487830 [Gossypium arboreum]|uniref:uncharacterized protein LOC108487830 n=1 Tax=Gossypium arboreum TaxID=29729 RepID=UPI0008191297|nr:uncharacterized protein LOC108487830 [Gossypium arboreum]